MPMLFCFGASWPSLIRKAWIARSQKGISLLFLAGILAGYAMGILNKLLVRYDGMVWL
jgi:hypothetical protein